MDSEREHLSTLDEWVFDAPVAQHEASIASEATETAPNASGGLTLSIATSEDVQGLRTANSDPPTIYEHDDADATYHDIHPERRPIVYDAVEHAVHVGPVGSSHHQVVMKANDHGHDIDLWSSRSQDEFANSYQGWLGPNHEYEYNGEPDEDEYPEGQGSEHNGVGWYTRPPQAGVDEAIMKHFNAQPAKQPEWDFTSKTASADFPHHNWTPGNTRNFSKVAFNTLRAEVREARAKGESVVGPMYRAMSDEAKVQFIRSRNEWELDTDKGREDQRERLAQYLINTRTADVSGEEEEWTAIIGQGAYDEWQFSDRAGEEGEYPELPSGWTIVDGSPSKTETNPTHDDAHSDNPTPTTPPSPTLPHNPATLSHTDTRIISAHTPTYPVQPCLTTPSSPLLRRAYPSPQSMLTSFLRASAIHPVPSTIPTTSEAEKLAGWCAPGLGVTNDGHRDHAHTEGGSLPLTPRTQYGKALHTAHMRAYTTKPSVLSRGPILWGLREEADVSDADRDRLYHKADAENGPQVVLHDSDEDGGHGTGDRPWAYDPEGDKVYVGPINGYHDHLHGEVLDQHGVDIYGKNFAHGRTGYWSYRPKYKHVHDALDQAGFSKSPEADEDWRFGSESGTVSASAEKMSGWATPEQEARMKAQWDADYAPNHPDGHSLYWTPGSPGKGYVTKDGKMATWNTHINGGVDHHATVIKKLGPPASLNHLFDVRENGYVHQALDARGAAPMDEYKHIEPRLNFVADNGWHFASAENFKPTLHTTDVADSSVEKIPDLANRVTFMYDHDKGEIYEGGPGMHHEDVKKHYGLPFNPNYGYGVVIKGNYSGFGGGEPQARWAGLDRSEFAPALDYMAKRHGVDPRYREEDWKFSSADPSPQDFPLGHNYRSDLNMGGKGIIDDSNGKVTTWNSDGFGWPHHSDVAEAHGILPRHFFEIDKDGKWDGWSGQPEIREALKEQAPDLEYASEKWHFGSDETPQVLHVDPSQSDPSHGTNDRPFIYYPEHNQIHVGQLDGYHADIAHHGLALGYPDYENLAYKSIWGRTNDNGTHEFLHNGYDGALPGHKEAVAKALNSVERSPADDGWDFISHRGPSTPAQELATFFASAEKILPEGYEPANLNDPKDDHKGLELHNGQKILWSLYGPYHDQTTHAQLMVKMGIKPEEVKKYLDSSGREPEIRTPEFQQGFIDNVNPSNTDWHFGSAGEIPIHEPEDYKDDPDQRTPFIYTLDKDEKPHVYLGHPGSEHASIDAPAESYWSNNTQDMVHMPAMHEGLSERMRNKSKERGVWNAEENIGGYGSVKPSWWSDNQRTLDYPNRDQSKNLEFYTVHEPEVQGDVAQAVHNHFGMGKSAWQNSEKYVPDPNSHEDDWHFEGKVAAEPRGVPFIYDQGANKIVAGFPGGVHGDIVRNHFKNTGERLKGYRGMADNQTRTVGFLGLSPTNEDEARQLAHDHFGYSDKEPEWSFSSVIADNAKTATLDISGDKLVDTVSGEKETPSSLLIDDFSVNKHLDASGPVPDVIEEVEVLSDIDGLTPLGFTREEKQESRIVHEHSVAEDEKIVKIESKVDKLSDLLAQMAANNAASAPKPRRLAIRRDDLGRISAIEEEG